MDTPPAFNGPRAPPRPLASAQATEGRGCKPRRHSHPFDGDVSQEVTDDRAISKPRNTCRSRARAAPRGGGLAVPPAGGPRRQVFPLSGSGTVRCQSCEATAVGAATVSTVHVFFLRGYVFFSFPLGHSHVLAFLRRGCADGSKRWLGGRCPGRRCRGVRGAGLLCRTEAACSPQLHDRWSLGSCRGCD